LIGALGAISGYWLAALLDASIAGAMVTMAGVIFGMVYIRCHAEHIFFEIREKVIDLG
jgi:ABC-type Mn2+/Zn2+ transport system permease subunit